MAETQTLPTETNATAEFLCYRDSDWNVLKDWILEHSYDKDLRFEGKLIYAAERSVAQYKLRLAVFEYEHADGQTQADQVRCAFDMAYQNMVTGEVVSIAIPVSKPTNLLTNIKRSAFEDLIPPMKRAELFNISTGMIQMAKAMMNQMGPEYEEQTYYALQ